MVSFIPSYKIRYIQCIGQQALFQEEIDFYHGNQFSA
ncbi:hypothetical protein FAEPRAM212_01067 [Faecalibacterium prausnitzii M21/2]|uniref:Uncharacterized protein n=1 Tax=Faecalibacterium prausnitzii M21/2 TaxID=411485 RepID=A8S9I6_9FIRM|nr:hypothetical protein FAEPRAM212_01067 [Faecalibacterium prausnitzii M21/2]